MSFSRSPLSAPTHISEFMMKTFQAAQLTHERFLTIDHSCKIFFWYLPNWTSNDLWFVVLYVTYSTTHQRSVEVQFGVWQISKTFCRSDLWSKISHVLVVRLETFSPWIHCLLTCRDKCCIFINVQVTLFNATVKLILLIWVFEPCSSLVELDNYKVQDGAMVYSGLWAVQFFTLILLTLRYCNIFLRN